MKKFDYSIIPSFTLFDQCKLSMTFQKGETVDSLIHTKITFSMDVDGNLNEDMNTQSESLERSQYFIATVEEYTKNIGDFSSKECCQQLLKEPNISEYTRLVVAEQEWMAELEKIKDEDHSKNIFTFFIQVRKNFESWFWNNEIEVTEHLENQNKKEPTSNHNTNNAKKKLKHQKNYDKEARLFVKVIKEAKSSFPTLKILEEKTNISISTWHRRFRNHDFLKKAIELINDQQRKLSSSDTEIFAILDNTHLELVKRWQSIPKSSKKKGLKFESLRDEHLEQYPTPTPEYFPESKDDHEEYNTKSLLRDCQFILN